MAKAPAAMPPNNADSGWPETLTRPSAKPSATDVDIWGIRIARSTAHKAKGSIVAGLDSTLWKWVTTKPESA